MKKAPEGGHRPGHHDGQVVVDPTNLDHEEEERHQGHLERERQGGQQGQKEGPLAAELVLGEAPTHHGGHPQGQRRLRHGHEGAVAELPQIGDLLSPQEPHVVLSGGLQGPPGQGQGENVGVELERAGNHVHEGRAGEQDSQEEHDVGQPCINAGAQAGPPLLRGGRTAAGHSDLPKHAQYADLDKRQDQDDEGQGNAQGGGVAELEEAEAVHVEQHGHEQPPVVGTAGDVAGEQGRLREQVVGPDDGEGHHEDDDGTQQGQDDVPEQFPAAGPVHDGGLLDFRRECSAARP